jgi:hypothetical protein
VVKTGGPDGGQARGQVWSQPGDSFLFLIFGKRSGFRCPVQNMGVKWGSGVQSLWGLMWSSVLGHPGIFAFGTPVHPCNFRKTTFKIGGVCVGLNSGVAMGSAQKRRDSTTVLANTFLGKRWIGVKTWCSCGGQMWSMACAIPCGLRCFCRTKIKPFF